jgi:ERCC4-type nuclease
MLARKFAYRYTKSEIKKLLKSLTVLVDTREQKNIHIRGYLDKNCIEHKSKKLNFGDYSFMLPENKELGIMRPIYFNDQVAIERKASLTELSNNFTHDRTQFENELIRSNGSKLILMVENTAGYDDIIKHNYSTNYKPKSFLATLHTFKHRYDLDTVFIKPELAGNYIYYSFYYWLREYLK